MTHPADADQVPEPRVDGLAVPTPLRAAITAATRRPEPEAVGALLAGARLSPAMAQAAQALALTLARGLREHAHAGGRAGLAQGLLQEFALSTQEGVALMCLAEALLRIPDAATRDALIRDKIGAGHWQAHLGHSPSLFVNAATWGLLLTGRLMAAHGDTGPAAALTGLVARGGEPLIRQGVDMAMRLLGHQFVAGQTIGEALAAARPREDEGFRHSFDMLGEAAMTAEDAERYRAAYDVAIHTIGQTAAGRGVVEGPGISVKLSALHPRYSRAQHARVMDELYPVLRALATLARDYDIGLAIDAEEADRLELSLDLLERLCAEPALAGWPGLGFVVQAYQKRAPFVVEYLIDLARRSGHRLMVRLVKGAYWDSEIKRAQQAGLDGYPVYTRKPYTDLAYLACARALLAVPDAIYPQFATHNAHTLAAIHQMAGPETPRARYEFQCLFGMGEPLYRQVVGARSASGLDRPCRIYAPVGTHATLLAYLVRRLLENGANSSFVNRLADPAVTLTSLVQDPVAEVQALAAREGALGLPHPAIALPRALYGPTRLNARGMDLADEAQLQALDSALRAGAGITWAAAPRLASSVPPGATTPVTNPADRRDIVGRVQAATPAEVDAALCDAQAAAPDWARTPTEERAAMLARAADTLEADMPRLVGLLVREAGKTWANAVAEVREAVDFLRYDAARVRNSFDNATHRPLGVVVCISPWNFPLAIFTGQVAAALAAGNGVLAKPAEQTPLIATEAVRHLHAAGVPPGALQLLPGPGETVGARLVADARVGGVLFTGSTEVARRLQRSLAGRLGEDGRPVPLVAETGGQNAMIVDSSALPEQVVADVLASAFDSAGQRCSALRVLCVQDELADRLLAMLRGAMRQLRLGNPARLAVDVGPVIDAEAQDGIVRHIEAMRARGRAVFQPVGGNMAACAHGSFVPPTLIELDSLAELQREVFGPVLHVLRWRRGQLDGLLAQIHATGYGLTMGLHTRIDGTIAQVAAQARVGNLYVNRNMVGAVVGVQPFGGEGLSGTGPKAGGPLYLLRLLACRPDVAVAQALAAAGRAVPPATPREAAPLRALWRWAVALRQDRLAGLCQRWEAEGLAGGEWQLAGPTGERNGYRLVPREAILCLADDGGDRLTQLAAVLAVGGRARWPVEAAATRARLPAAVQARITLQADALGPDAPCDLVLYHGAAAGLRALNGQLAERAGPIVSVVALAPGATDLPLERLLVERAVSINTAAAGGNASLMTLGADGT